MKCLICETDESTEKHHVLPRSKGGREQDNLLDCCSDCGGQVHMLFNNTELAKMSLDDLLTNEKMQKYIIWKKKHPGTHRHRMSNGVKSWRKSHRA
jgi:hypothetical protein